MSPSLALCISACCDITKGRLPERDKRSKQQIYRILIQVICFEPEEDHRELASLLVQGQSSVCVCVCVFVCVLAAMHDTDVTVKFPPPKKSKLPKFFGPGHSHCLQRETAPPPRF